VATMLFAPANCVNGGTHRIAQPNRCVTQPIRRAAGRPLCQLRRPRCALGSVASEPRAGVRQTGNSFWFVLPLPVATVHAAT
jgi:hypothetical protein